MTDESDGAGARVHDVVVVGGGQAGLAVARHLQQRATDVVVLDAGPEPGHAWRTRWDSLVLFTPAEYSGLPGMPMPGPGTHPTKDEVADHLAAYEARYGLPVRHGVRVDRVEPGPAGYRVLAGDERLDARQVVVATGPYQVPVVPGVAAGFAASVAQCHSAAYRRPRALPDGPVLVVGGGNSGRQIALELAASRSVVLAVGERVPVLPQRLLGRDLFWWLTRTGIVSRSVDTALGRRLRDRGEIVVGSSLRGLRRAGVDVRPRLVGADADRASFADGTTARVAAVVWATGFRLDHSWIAVPGALDERGAPAHHRGVSGAPGFYFLGLSWLHTRGSALVGFVGADAEHLAEEIERAADAGLPHQPIV